MSTPPLVTFFFFFNDTATTEIYTLSLHDALPISFHQRGSTCAAKRTLSTEAIFCNVGSKRRARSEEHTSELQSQSNLVCRLLLEKKKKNKTSTSSIDHDRSCRHSTTPHSPWFTHT